jgi:hypothetical protein
MSTTAKKRPRLPWLTAKDARMLNDLRNALGPDARREMSNLLHQQDRSNGEFDKRVVRDDLSTLLEPGPPRTAQLRRLPDQVVDDHDRWTKLIRGARFGPVQALLSAVHADVLTPDGRLALAARTVLSRKQSDEPEPLFLKALADQYVAGARANERSFSVAAAARKAGLNEKTAMRRLCALVVAVEDEFVMRLPTSPPLGS